jgi:hypothetical protein
MPENDALRRVTVRSATIGSIATDASSYFPITGPQPHAGEVIAAYFQNGTTSSATSGTTTGSSASIVVYKNASNAASVIATFNGSGTNVATLAAGTLLKSGTAGTTNSRFAAGDRLIGEVKGGAANNGSQAGAFIEVALVYGYADGDVPTAGTGPA